MRLSSLLVTKARWLVAMYLFLHFYIWTWYGNESHCLKEILNASDGGGASVPDWDFIDSTADDVPLRLTHQAPSKSDFLATGSSKRTAAKTPKRRNLVESFVISFDTDNVEQFEQRNNHSGLGDVLWVPGVDGYQQKTLDLWAKLTGQEAMNATNYTRGNQEQKNAYRSPHAVGCYLAHYHLLRSLRHRPHELQPSLYFIFEDDASCAPNLVDEMLKVTQKLPPDWDLFFIGGKPMTFFSEKFTLYEDSSNETLERDVCRGAFGKGSSPLSPEGSRRISEQDAYWKIKYLTNTHAYVINPNRLHHVMEILKPAYDVPIDIKLADAMKEDRLNAYMPTQEWCRSDIISPWKYEKPIPWYGFYIWLKEAAKHPHLPKFPGIWQPMAQENCLY